MRRALLVLLVAVLTSTSIYAAERYGPVITVSDPPAGACRTREVQIVSGSDPDDKGEQYCCVGWTPGGAAGAWASCLVAAAPGAGGSTTEVQVNVGGALTGDPAFKRTPETGTSPPIIKFDDGTLHEVGEPRTVLRWMQDPAHAQSSDAGYSLWVVCSGYNQGVCSGGTNDGTPCWASGLECTGGGTCVGAHGAGSSPDPAESCDWVLSESWNSSPLDGNTHRVADPDWPSGDITRENPGWTGISPDGKGNYTQEYIYRVYDDYGADNNPGRETIQWHLSWHPAGRCSADTTGGRAGELCLPGGLTDGDPDGVNFGCPGPGTCQGSGFGTAKLNTGSFGFCATDPKTLCQEDAECASADCNWDPADNAYWFVRTDYQTPSANVEATNLPSLVAPAAWLFAGNLTSDGFAASVVEMTTAPQAGDVDGAVVGERLTATLGPYAEATSEVANITAQHARLDLAPTASNVDANEAFALKVETFVRPTGDNGTIGAGWGTDTTDNNVFDVRGIDAASDFSGAVDTYEFFWDVLRIRRPIGNAGDSKQLMFRGIHIEDVFPSTGAANWGVINAWPIQIDPCSGASALDCNFFMGDYNDATGTGGALWNNGHPQFGKVHIWNDETGSGAARVSYGAPTAATSGGEILLGECGSVEVNPSDFADYEPAEVTTAVSELSATNLCNCRVDTADTTQWWIESCKATAGNLVSFVYDNGVVGDIPAATVYYCCFEN